MKVKEVGRERDQPIETSGFIYESRLKPEGFLENSALLFLSL